MLKSETRETLLSMSTPFLVDARSSLRLPESHLDHGIKPVVPFSRMVGSAVTVRIEVAPNEESADLVPMVEAYESQSESSLAIIVIQMPPELYEYGIFGEGAATMARRHGYVGALVDGTVRDSHELKAMQFPVFTRHVSPGYIVGLSSAVGVGEPVLVGGRTVHQGDIIVGDNNGVIVLRPDEIDDVLARARAIHEWEQRSHKLLAEGVPHSKIRQIAGPFPSGPA